MRPSSFNPVCRELGAPPWAKVPERGLAWLSIPFAGSWGLRRRRPRRDPRRRRRRPGDRFQSRLPGVGGSASKNTAPCGRPSFQSRLPGVGGSAAANKAAAFDHIAFNPVCRELGAPPSPGAARRPPSSATPFNPVCRELGAPPYLAPSRPVRPCLDFQSRLPGVGGSARDFAARHREGLGYFQSRLPGVGGSALRLLGGLQPHVLSIPFAGSWGLRLGFRGLGPPPTFQSRLPGVGGSAEAAQVCARYDLTFQSRLPGVGGSAPTFPQPSRENIFQSRLPGVGGSASLAVRRRAAGLLSIPFAGSWGLRPEAGAAEYLAAAPAFNPVCRELGAPPQTETTVRKERRAFNPVCRELGAPPTTTTTPAAAPAFQSRLPGVGGSAHECEEVLRAWRLSIPFAGSWGLRQSDLGRDA